MPVRNRRSNRSTALHTFEQRAPTPDVRDDYGRRPLPAPLLFKRRLANDPICHVSSPWAIKYRAQPVGMVCG